MFRCPNCGGGMNYSIEDKMLKCSSCGCMIKPKDYKTDNSAQENEPFETDGRERVTVYTCKNCGAELESPDDSLVAYCPYCGSEQTLEGRMEGAERPEKILPFKISKEECKNRYKNELGKLFYLPKEFKDPDYIDKFRGVYIPYCGYEINMDGTIPVIYSETRKVGTVTYEDTYFAEIVAEGVTFNVAEDLSPIFDDTISDHISPFDTDNETDYFPAYLAGFYADRPGTDDSAYDSEVINLSVAAVENQINAFNATGKIKKNISEDEIRSDFNPEINKKTLSLLPVWFLTWKKKDRVAYTVMNSRSGKMLSDLPVDGKKYFISSLITAAVAAVILVFFNFTAVAALSVTSLLTAVMMMVFDSEVIKLRDRENHVYDPAYTGKVKMEKDKIENLRNKKTKNKNVFRRPAIALLIFAVVVLIFAKDSPVIPVSVSFVVGLCLFFKDVSAAKYIDEKKEIFSQTAPFLSLLISTAVAWSGTIDDEYYYISSLLCLISAVIVSVALIKVYNILVTRPVPSFFAREGGNDSK